jgi:hypothetical protein
MVLKDPQVPKDQGVFKEFKVLLDQKAIRVIKEIRA